MAGIGFNLKQILKEDTAQSILSAYFYTCLVSSGPWLFSVIALSLISFWGSVLTSPTLLVQFMGLAVYAFAFSMIITSGSQWVITRQVSDCLYSNEIEKIPGIFMGSSLLVLLLTCLTGIPFLWWMDIPLRTTLISFALYVLTSQMWMTMVFVSALKTYMRIVWAFLLGFVLAIPIAIGFGIYFGRDGFLLGLTLGISLIVFMLALSIFAEYDGDLRPSRLVLKAHQRYWFLYLCSFIMTLGLWIDKIILWYGEGKSVIGFIKIYPVYDGAIFIAYLTVLPAMAFFVMIIETDFYQDFRRYFYLIEKKVSYLVLEHIRQDMVAQLTSNGTRVIIFQIILTSTFIFISPWLIPILRLDWMQWHILRVGCVAAFLHMSFSLLNVVLAYFDARVGLFCSGLTFLVVNWAVTWLSIGNFWWYGYGYLLAGFAGTCVSLGFVIHRLKSLHYYTFVGPNLA